MSAFPNNPPWGNNGALNNQSNNLPVGLHGGHQVNSPPYQNSWQQQVPPQQQMAQQPMYPSQQTYWNNNINQKPPPMNTSQPNYQPDRSSPWGQNPQPQYAPQQPQPQFQQHQVHYNNPPNSYPYENYQPNISTPQQGYAQQNYASSDQFGGDAWNWGWEESSNSTPSASFSTNNNFQNDPTWDWNVDDNTSHDFQPTNPVQNYFQPGSNQVAKEAKSEQFQNDKKVEPTSVPIESQNYFENAEQPSRSEENSLKVSDETEAKALTVENVAEVNSQSGDDTVFDVKSESAHSYQSGSLSNTSEFKNERLSPDPNKIPLTTQALREFHKEIYENGPVNLKSRLNAEGLTPQWSIESQMSQDTISDDISPSIQGGSQSDIDTRPSTVSQSPSSNQHADPTWYEYGDNANESRIEENLSNLRNSYPAQEQETKRVPPQQHFIAVRNDLYDEVSSNLESLSISNQGSSVDDVENKEIVSPEQKGSLNKSKIVPPPVSRPGEGSSSNPYSASGSLIRKSANKRTDNLINPPAFQSPAVENENYVNQSNSTVVEDSLNQQVLGGPGTLGWYNKNVGLTDESVNLETVPDNKERPDAVEQEIRQISSSSVNARLGARPIQSFSNVSYDNYEVSPRVKQDRNQYLETGQLGDMTEIAVSDADIPEESIPPPGLSRLVTGERQHSLNSNTENSGGGVSTPPPGLDRMVLGQMTENENSTIPDVISFNHHHHQSTPPPGLHRMVLGQLTDDQNTNSAEENQNNSASNATRDDIPPPGFHRMVPGESSSPETQNVIQLSIDTLPREQRVVTGVARDEIDVNPLQTDIPSASPTPANRLSSQSTNPDENRIQFQSERCETIGSDNVDNFTTSQVDSSSSKQIKRKDNKDRDRDRDRLREDISSDERERDPPRRRDRDSDYYRERDRNREREDPPSGERPRYRDDRERRSKRDRVDWDRDRRKDSPDRYREDKDRRRDYRDGRRRHRDSDYSDDEDADINGYYSDRDRRNMSGYRDDFDKSFSRRDDRARSLRPEKSPRDGNDDSISRSSGRDKRRGYSDRDRERDRDGDRDRDRDRDHRQPDYYRRKRHDDIDDYRDSQRSRPSSRNGSVHDYKPRGLSSRDYEGDRDRDRDHYRGHSKRDRDMYYPQGYNHDPAYYNYCYQYYENLRRTNPAAYAELCRKYYAQSQHGGTFDGTYTEDRGSVHSGRSSANEENKDRRLDSSLQMEDTSTSIHRLTPAKFTTAHVKGILTPRGQMIKILAHYPLDGQPATLELHDQLVCLDDVRKELQDFPGPLVKGVTHKNNVLRYCKQKIKDADSNPNLFDKDSYKLIWELLILMIRQNGTVVGTDIAELLMSNRKAHTSIHQPSPSPATSHHSITEVVGGSGSQPNLSEEEVTNQFRDYLIYGNTKEALEWAMKHGLWGHALFLASKMDQRTYASVMTRFANGLTMNDPLQTLYQLMSGRQPAAVTCCADEKWGDWRPHLAMILSNPTARTEIDIKAITTLGDTLGSRGSLHAAHFCYLMAQVEFGSYAHKSSKIVLIGSSHNQPFKKFSSNEAIFATEIFEFACNLADPDFFMPHLQIYKLLIARRLTEAGILQEAVHYAEVIANNIAKCPDRFTPSFIQEVYDLGDMLKYFDPVYSNSEAVDSNSDPGWLVQLLNILNDYQMGVITHAGYGSVSNLTTYSENDNIQNLPLDPVTDTTDNHSWQHQQQQQLHQQQLYYEQNVHQQQWQSNEHGVNGFPSMSANENYQAVEQPVIPASPSEEANQSYWSNQNQWMPHQPSQELNLPTSSGGEYSGTTPETQEPNKPPSYNYFEPSRNEGMQQPITLPGSVTLPNSKPRTMSQSSDDKKPLQPGKPKTTKREQGKPNQASSSWFGGLFSKILAPKNQMILPDDKNPSIVWDPDKKRWVNLDADGDEAVGAPPPPPKASELPTGVAPSQPAPPSFNANNIRGRDPQPEVAATAPNVPPSGPNKYKMSRGKSLRSNYVDVMNPGATTKPSNPAAPTPELFPNFGYTAQAPTNYFIPAPVEGNENAPTDFLTPSPAPVLSAHDSSDQSQTQHADQSST